jgi:bacterioferritin-associated ferredoxin
MYVCNCNGITERDIQGAVALGCTSVKELNRELGVGSCCGKCVPDARSLLKRCGAARTELRCAGGDD